MSDADGYRVPKAALAGNNTGGGPLKLRDAVKTAQRMLSDSSTGPLFAAVEIMRIVDDWPAWEAEAGGVSAKEWVFSTFARHVRWFAERRDAVLWLGRDVARNVDHVLAVWVAKNMQPTGKRKDRTLAYLVAKSRELGRPVDKTRVRESEIYELAGKARRKSVHTCAELEFVRSWLREKKLLSEYETACAKWRERDEE